MGHRHHFSLHSRPSTTIHFGNISNCSILVGRRCPHRLKLRQCRHPSAVFKFHGERGKPRGEGEKEGGEESRGTIIPAARRRVTDFGIRQIPFKSRHFLSKTRRGGETGRKGGRESKEVSLQSAVWKTWKKFQPPRRVRGWIQRGRFTRVGLGKD